MLDKRIELCYNVSLKMRCSKVPYKDEGTAWNAAYELYNRGIFNRDVKVYACPYCRNPRNNCRMFHLTTAKVQLHNAWWRDKKLWSPRIYNWFRERGTIEQWDQE